MRRTGGIRRNVSKLATVAANEHSDQNGKAPVLLAEELPLRPVVDDLDDLVKVGFAACQCGRRVLRNGLRSAAIDGKRGSRRGRLEFSEGPDYRCDPQASTRIIRPTPP